MTNQSKECRYCNFKNLIDSKACKTCGADVADWYITADQSNTLGTTMEERLATEYKEYENREVELSREKIIRFWLDKLSQSKTDLLNALIDRENREKKDIITEHPTTTLEFLEEGQILGFNQAKTDTINHLKSLRDVA